MPCPGKDIGKNRKRQSCAEKNSSTRHHPIDGVQGYNEIANNLVYPVLQTGQYESLPRLVFPRTARLSSRYSAKSFQGTRQENLYRYGKGTSIPRFDIPIYQITCLYSNEYGVDTAREKGKKQERCIAELIASKLAPLPAESGFHGSTQRLTRPTHPGNSSA